MKRLVPTLLVLILIVFLVGGSAAYAAVSGDLLPHEDDTFGLRHFNDDADYDAFGDRYDDFYSDEGSVSGFKKASSVPEFIAPIIQWALGTAGLLAVAVIIYGGYMYITSRGNQITTERAKTIVLYAVIGLVVIILSFFVVAAVFQIYDPPGADPLSPDSPFSNENGNLPL